MKNYFFFLIALFTALSALSQENYVDSNNLKQGHWKFKRRTSLVECFYVNDTLNGQYKVTIRKGLRKGQTVEETYYAMGLLNGQYRSYWLNGLPTVEMKFTNGLPDSIYHFYDSQGNLAKEIYYKYGKFDGHYTCYYRRKKIYEADFKNGFIDGTFYEYFPNGKIYIKSIFVEGKMLSGEYHYDRDGKLIMLKLPNETRDRLKAVIEYDENGSQKPKTLFINERPVTVLYFGEGTHQSGEIISDDSE